MKNMFRRKKGSIMLFIIFIITGILIILIGAVFAPMGVLFNVKMFEAGDMILNQSLNSINGIQDTEIRAEINATINSARSGTQNNIEVNSAIFQYSWVLMLVVTGLVVFIYTRRLSEYNQGGLI